MRWAQGRRSGNIEDRRGMRMPGGRAGGIGLFGILIALVAMFFGFDPGLFLGPGQQIAPPQQTSAPASPEAEQMRDFVSVVLGETEATWEPIFRQAGADYREPTLVLYSGLTPTACGTGQSAAGPFYCPADQKVYLDTSFFEEMRRRFGAAGDFAHAYVIAHEVGHHVQTLLGITQEVEKVRRSGDQRAANDASVRFELQADCLAGVWANHTQARTGMLERGDVEEALNAASAIGDDRIQAQTQGYVVPDAFTHGSSEQRVRWFYAGLESGDLAACNTFDIARP